MDKHIYSRENGLAISAMTTLYQATGTPGYLREAETAARWIVGNRSLGNGGFSHDQTDTHGPFLADQVYMGRALLLLYQATADRKWLDLSTSCADFCAEKFVRSDKGRRGILLRRSFPRCSFTRRRPG